MANTEENNFPFGLCKSDADFLKSFHSILKELRLNVISNIEYYQRGKSSIHSCFYSVSSILLERTQSLESQVCDIVPKLHKYDFSEDVQANGYRSFISVVDRCCLHLVQLCRHISVNKTNLLFRSSFYLKELEAYVETLGQLMAFLGYLQELMSHSENGELFLEDDFLIGDDLLLEVETLNTDCFYGRCLGFQFHESMMKALKAVNIIMATFSECYEEKSQVIQLASSLLNTGKYYVDDNLRAKQVVDITRTADIKFCKAFWSIAESPLLHQLRSLTFPHIQISEVMSLPPENFELPIEGSSDEMVMITPPCAHTGPSAVQVRLISHAMREGMMEVGRQLFRPKTGSSVKTPVLGKSPGLLFHCHGGGFVAQSSQSHENYLRLWAQKLEMPILSVDYSLAPEQPFPRALEETFYAYAWALKNPDKLGWTGERVCFAGDSAGGNIAISTALRAVSYKIKIPDGIMAAYTPTLVQYTPSPARLMSMIDPLLPVGILTRCLAAYAGIADKFSDAISKAIYCNPGQYETWEVVEQNEEDSDETDNPIGCDAPQSSNQSKGCNECSTSDGYDVDSRCKCYHRNEDNKENGVKAVTSKIVSIDKTGELKRGSRCDSIENMADDEYVVFDFVEMDDGTFRDSDCMSRTSLGNDTPVKVRSSSEESEVIRQNLAEAMCEGSRTASQESVETGSVKNPVPVTPTGQSTDQANVTTNNAEKADTSQDTNTKFHDKMDVDLVNEEIELGCASQVEPQCFQSIDEMLSALDSNVVIQVDECKSPRDDDSSAADIGAVCQELLPPLGSDMANLSCISLEDLIEVDEQTDGHFDVNGGACSNSTADAMTRKLKHKQVQLTQQNPLPSTSDIINDSLAIDGRFDAQGLLKSPYVSKSPSCPDSLISEQDVTLRLKPQKAEREGECNQEESDSSKNGTTASMRRALSMASPMPSPKMKRRHKSVDLGSNTNPCHGLRLSPGSITFAPKLFSAQRKIAQSPIKLFRQLPIVKNYYMSPLLAPDELLLGLPEIHLHACQFDPLLDDSVMFAKKLKKLEKPVLLKVYDHLPHGFLNFYDASTEARKATDGCLDSIVQFLLR